MQPSEAIDWAIAGDEALTYLRDLLRIDTTNPPGNEKPAAEYLAEALHADGLEPTLLESAPGRGNVVARLKSGEGGPLLLGSHLDVVPAEPERWTHPPFAAEEADGYIWGRGAIDMKNMTAMSLMVVKLLARQGVKLKRDIIFTAVADEEAGSDHGARFLVEEHPELVRAEYALGEVGGFSLYLRGRTYYPIQVAEKGLCWMTMTARGDPGHGSIPHDNNAVVKLSRAVRRIGRRRLPQHTTPAVADFIRGLAAHQSLPARFVLPLLLSPWTSGVILRWLLPDKAAAQSFAAQLSNTANPTVLHAGSKTNVVPAEASAEIDGRLLPGQSAEDLTAELRARVGRKLGSEIEFEVRRHTSATVTSPDTPLYRRIVETLRRLDPDGIPVPYMIPGFTDASQYARLGAKCYGFSPLRLDPKDDIPFSRLYHGHDERIPVSGFRFGLRVLYDLVYSFCA